MDDREGCSSGIRSTFQGRPNGVQAHSMAIDESQSGDPADPGPALRRGHDVRREGPGHVVPADRTDPRRRTGRRTCSSSSSMTPASAPTARSAGPCQTPTFERLAADGLKYTRFHTTALCSPTRAALLSGRNHHTVGMGGITEIATSAPGYSSVRPNTCAPLAETLKLNGYSTAQFGKCHEVPGLADEPDGPVRPRGRASAAGSSTSTASSAARPTSTRRRCTTARRRSSPT